MKTKNKKSELNQNGGIMEQKKGKTLGILSVSLGWLIPLVGLILGIIGLVKSNNKPATTLNIIGIIESVLFWIFYLILFMDEI